MSLLVIFEILELFVNTLTPDDKYSLCNSEYLSQRIQMQLSKKRKTFSHFFVKFLKFTSNFEHFETKDGPFRTPSDRQHAKRSQTLMKLEWQHFFHFFITLTKTELEIVSLSDM